MADKNRELVETIEFHTGATLARARALLAAGADPNAKRGAKDLRVLHWAVLHDDEPLARLLVDAGADVNAQDNKDQSAPLHFARRAGTARLLTAAGAQVDARDRNRNTPLLIATAHPNPDTAPDDTATLVGALIEAGADVNATGKTRIPPLHAALAAMPDPIVNLLLDARADPNVDVKDIGTALHQAAAYDRAAAADRLIRSGADVNRGRKGDRWTPLHQAASSNAEEVARALLAAGADVSAADAFGRTPADYAHTDQMRNLLATR